MEFKNVFFAIENEIEAIIRDYWITIDPYNINDDGSIDVFGNVKFSANYLTELPLRFNIVTGNFDCSKLNLETLKNAPLEVGGNFDCSFNKLTSLKYAPAKVGGTVTFDNTLKTICTGNVNCYFNEVRLLYRTDLVDMRLPDIISDNADFLKVVFKYQQYFTIWNCDSSLNEKLFDLLIKEIGEGLE